MPKITDRNQLIAELPPLTNLIKGSLLCYHHEGCRCHPKGRYGPYCYLSVNQDGKTKMRKLDNDQVPNIRQALKNYQRWWKTCLRIFEINTQLTLSKKED